MRGRVDLSFKRGPEDRADAVKGVGARRTMVPMSATLMPSHRVFGPRVPALSAQKRNDGLTRAHRGVAVRVTAMGAKYKRTDVEVARQIGEGSFGVVYQGKIEARRAGDVVLKRPKLTVEGAAELQEVEAWMNDRVTRDARGSCADFLGSFRVTPDESYLNSSEGIVAKEGLWLVWKFEGDRTLAQYMAQPDYPAGIAKNLLDINQASRGDPAVELEVTQAVMRQLFKNLASVHRAGLVHRDIKPHNLVLTDDNFTNEREPRFKIIDLGACACFRTGMNFAPRRDNHGSEVRAPRGVPHPERRRPGHPQALRARRARRGKRRVGPAQTRSIRHVQRGGGHDAARAPVASNQQRVGEFISISICYFV